MKLNFYIIGNDGDDTEDIQLFSPQIISSSDNYIDIGLKVSDRDKLSINRLIEINDNDKGECNGKIL